MEMDFRKFLEQNTIGYHNDGPGSGFNPTGGAYLSSDQTGSESSSSPNLSGHPQHLPSTDLSIPNNVPTLRKKSSIVRVERTTNPISVFLADGTRLHFTYDEFKRIPGGEPRAGKQVTVVFQRRANDRSDIPSQVQSIRID